MFQFPSFPFCDYFIHHRIYGSSPYGFPHSEIPGLALICSYPRLIAACHVLLRLLMPRHSPCALISLNFFSNSSLFSFVLQITWVSQIIVTVVVLVVPPCDKIVVTTLFFAWTSPCFFAWFSLLIAWDSQFFLVLGSSFSLSKRLCLPPLC